MRQEVGKLLEADFSSALVRYLRAHGYSYRSGDLTFRLAAEFGFCYGVDRAVEYAFAARHRFPHRKIWLTGEIIHNPRVNRRLVEMGLQFLPDSPDPAIRYQDLDKDDVIMIPAFGADSKEMLWFLDQGFEIVDTTCGSVLNVWKRVRLYAELGFTSVVHGKYDHEETLATCSQVTSANPDGKYLVIHDLSQAERLAECITKRDFSDFEGLVLPEAVCRGFDPVKDLRKIGLANQTTMLESESRTIQGVLRDAMCEVVSEGDLADHFLSFDTICSATEDRQQAVKDLIGKGIDRMIVIGGFNSSNTSHLLEISLPNGPAYHIESPECLIDRDQIRAKPLNGGPEIVTGWLPTGPQTIGITGGASTPDSVVGQVVRRILNLGGGTAPGKEEMRPFLLSDPKK